MIYLDANVILRYLLDDIPQHTAEAQAVFNSPVYIPH
jgi:predicted nucleic acid-binding protein